MKLTRDQILVVKAEIELMKYCLKNHQFQQHAYRHTPKLRKYELIFTQGSYLCNTFKCNNCPGLCYRDFHPFCRSLCFDHMGKQGWRDGEIILKQLKRIIKQQ